MAQDSRYIQIACSIQRMLQNDGKLDDRELDELLGMALKDGQIDENERKVLGLVFDKLTPRDVTPPAWWKISEVRRKHGI